jgi:hypothetical protein
MPPLTVIGPSVMETCAGQPAADELLPALTALLLLLVDPLGVLEALTVAVPPADKLLEPDADVVASARWAPTDSRKAVASTAADRCTAGDRKPDFELVIWISWY